jgi:hypothetical protein
MPVEGFWPAAMPAFFISATLNNLAMQTAACLDTPPRTPSPLVASDKPCDEDEIAIHLQLRPHNIRESDRVTVIARMLALRCGDHPCTFHAG